VRARGKILLLLLCCFDFICVCLVGLLATSAFFVAVS